MKASWRYRAANRYVAPTRDVIATTAPGASNTVRLSLFTNDRTKFLVEMSPAEARALAAGLREQAREIDAKAKETASWE